MTKSVLLTLALTASFAAHNAVAADDHAAKADPAKGQAIASTVCVACHGADGNSTAPANPKLAGQHVEYLEKQISNFKAAEGKQPERVNGIMNGMVATLSADDVRNVAAWYASQKQTPEAAKNQETIALGQKIYRAGDPGKGVAACSACHGPTGTGIPAQFPRLSGQFADYTEAQLKAFRSGERANDPAKMMRTVADRLSDKEIKAVSDYIAGLR